ncbi:MAG TPA: carbohydrate ABC transporter permease [bacterium]|jgi:multiple sugar transport system permease protein|nr:carbohydrate ABC transporter permease [bacterium]
MKRIRRTAKLMFIYAAVAVVLIWALFPVFWIASSSIRPQYEIVATPLRYLPQTVTFRSYKTAFADPAFLRALRNTVAVASLTTILGLAAGALAAYAFARFDFKLKRPLFLSIFLIRMIPAFTLAIPLFVAMRTFGLIDTIAALVLTHTTLVLPVSILIMRTFFENLPAAYEEAAMMDGATRLQVLTRIVLPLSTPALMVAGVVSMISSWNDYLFGLLFTLTKARTIMVAIADVEGAFYVDYPLIVARGMIALIPPVVAALAFQRYLVRGLTGGVMTQ